MGSRSRRKAALVCVLVPLVLSCLGVSACGGAADSGLFDATSGASEGTDAGTPADGATSADSKNPPSSPPNADSGPIVPPPPQKDAASADPGIQCGTASCAVDTEVCCRTHTGGTVGSDSFACTPPASCADSTATLAIPCDDTADCAALGHPGTVCCAVVASQPPSQTTRAIAVSCENPAVCISKNSRVYLCDPKDPNPCPSGAACKLSIGTLVGYYLCLF